MLVYFVLTIRVGLLLSAVLLFCWHTGIGDVNGDSDSGSDNDFDINGIPSLPLVYLLPSY